MSDSIFDDYQIQREAAKQRQQENWEERVVKKLLDARGLTREALVLAKHHHTLTGTFRITFADFLVEYGNFNVYLHCRKVPYLHKLTYEDLFKKQTRLSVVKLFNELAEEVPEVYVGVPRGVVFEWLHSGGPFKIIHDYPVNRHCGVQISIPNNKQNDSFLTIQNLDDFLVGIGWKELEEEK